MFFAKVKAEAEVSPHERRRSIRHTTVMQLAKIRLASGQEELCLLRDVSPEGVKAEIYIRIDEGACVQIELRTGHRIDGRIAWSEGKMVGVAFDEPTLMTVMLAHCSFDDRLGKLRPPRLRVDLRGVLKVGVQEKVVRIGNISQAGLQDRRTGAAPCHAGLHDRATGPRAPDAAMIRWCRERASRPDAGHPTRFRHLRRVACDAGRRRTGSVGTETNSSCRGIGLLP